MDTRQLDDRSLEAKRLRARLAQLEEAVRPEAVLVIKTDLGEVCYPLLDEERSVELVADYRTFGPFRGRVLISGVFARIGGHDGRVVPLSTPEKLPFAIKRGATYRVNAPAKSAFQ